jgi:hypothetical protein
VVWSVWWCRGVISRQFPCLIGLGLGQARHNGLYEYDIFREQLCLSRQLAGSFFDRQCGQSSSCDSEPKGAPEAISYHCALFFAQALTATVTTALADLITRHCDQVSHMVPPPLFLTCMEQQTACKPLVQKTRLRHPAQRLELTQVIHQCCKLTSRPCHKNMDWTADRSSGGQIMLMTRKSVT